MLLAILISPNKGETAVHGCHCPDDVVVRMRKVLAIPRSLNRGVGRCASMPSVGNVSLGIILNES